MECGFLLVHLNDDYSNLLATVGLYARVIYYQYQSQVYLMVCYPGNIILPHLITFAQLKTISSRVMRYRSLHPFAPYHYHNCLPPAMDLLEMWTSDYHCYRIFYDTLKLAIPDYHRHSFLSYFATPDDYVIPDVDPHPVLTRNNHQTWINHHWEVTVAHFLEHRSLLIPRVITFLSYHRQLHHDLMTGYIDRESYRRKYQIDLPDHLIVMGPASRSDLAVLYDIEQWVHRGGDLNLNEVEAVLQRLLPVPTIPPSQSISRQGTINNTSYRGTMHSFSEYDEQSRLQALSPSHLQALCNHLGDNHLLPGLQQLIIDRLTAPTDESPSPT